jgi:hypothetical protein
MNVTIDHKYGTLRISGITISFPKEKLSQIDAQRGDIPRSRFLLRVWEKAYNSKNEGKEEAH